jgi:hypothetical protein
MNFLNFLLALDGTQPVTNHFNWDDGVAMGLGNMGAVIFFLDLIFLGVMGYVLCGALFQKTDKNVAK